MSITNLALKPSSLRTFLGIITHSTFTGLAVMLIHEPSSFHFDRLQPRIDIKRT